MIIISSSVKIIVITISSLPFLSLFFFFTYLILIPDARHVGEVWMNWDQDILVMDLKLARRRERARGKEEKLSIARILIEIGFD